MQIPGFSATCPGNVIKVLESLPDLYLPVLRYDSKIFFSFLGINSSLQTAINSPKFINLNLFSNPLPTWYFLASSPCTTPLSRPAILKPKLLVTKY